MLADELLAARGAPEDWGGIITNVAKVVEKAQRFEPSDDVVAAANNLCMNRPSSLVEMQRFCRLPFANTWFEWKAGRIRKGCLLETDLETAPQGGFATWVWAYEEHGRRTVEVNPLGVMFDWSDGFTMPEQMRKYFRSLGNDSYTSLSHDGAADMMRNNLHVKQAWGRYSSNEDEIEALVKLDASVAVFPSGHAITMLQQLDARVSMAEQQPFMQQWNEYLTGEPPFIRAVVTLLNCKNGLTHEPASRSDKVNKHRIKSGKPPLLDYVTTRLAISPAQQRRADAQGIDRQTARQHLVRGHLKTIRGNLYWWSPHLRGDPLRPVVRQGYMVKA
jgi:hypothetical protein